jgi:hypothetical protein
VQARALGARRALMFKDLDLLPVLLQGSSEAHRSSMSNRGTVAPLMSSMKLAPGK